jgi:hypothetical protein
MTIVDFTTTDGKSYVIPAQNIACLSPNNEKGGTFVELVSGTVLHTFENINDLTRKLREV